MPILIGWQRWLAYGAVLMAALAVAEIHGYYRGKALLFDYQAKQAVEAVKVVVKQGAVTDKIVTKYRDRVRWVREPAQVITKEIPVYVPASADPVLPRGWGMLHDAAAAGTVPQAAAGADVSAPDVAASQALRSVVANYTTCHETELQLVTLQAWVQMQYEAMNLKPLEYE